MEQVRFGVIGIGNMGSHHVQKLFEGAIPGAVLAAVCDVKETRLEWAKGIHEEYVAGVSMAKYPPHTATKAERMIRCSLGPETDALPVSAIRIGPAVFVGLPGEPFNGIGMGLKANSPFTVTLPCFTASKTWWLDGVPLIHTLGYVSVTTAVVRPPLGTLNETPLTALTSPAGVKKEVCRSFTSNNDMISPPYFFSFGSKASRRPSPSRFSDRTIRQMATAGMIKRWG